MAFTITERSVTKRNRNKRTPTAGLRPYGGGGGGSSTTVVGGGDSGVSLSIENDWIASQNFEADTNFKNDIFIMRSGLETQFIQIVSDTTGHRFDADGNKDITFSNESNLAITIGQTGITTIADLIVSGTTSLDSLDSIRLNDNYVNIGFDNASAEDGGLKVINSAQVEAGRFFFDVDIAAWSSYGDDFVSEGGVFATSYASSINIDHIWHDEALNQWNFCSDTTHKGVANSRVNANSFYTTSDGNSTQWKTAYDHSQTTTGNPHSLDLADIGETYASINYWTLGSGNLYRSTGKVGVGTTNPQYGNFESKTTDGDATTGFALYSGAGSTSGIYHDSSNALQITRAGIDDNGMVLKSDGNIYFGNYIGSKTFSTGFSGTGWQIDSDGAATLKSLLIREDFQVFTLSVEEVKVGSASQIFTEGAKVVFVDGSKIVYDKNYNIFEIGQILRCQQWNGVTEVKYYQIEVDTVGTQVGGDYDGNRYLTYVTKSGSGVPSAGDNLVRVSGDVLEVSSRDGGYLQIADGITTTAGSFTSQLKIGDIDGSSSTAKPTNATGYGILTDKFVVDEDGAYFSGRIESTEGEIGGWTISSSSISKGTVALDSTNSAIKAGATSYSAGDGVWISSTANQKFRVGNASASRMQWNDTDLKFYNSSNQEVVSIGATNTIAGLNFTNNTMYKTVNDSGVAFYGSNGTLRAYKGSVGYTGDGSSLTSNYIDFGVQSGTGITIKGVDSEGNQAFSIGWKNLGLDITATTVVNWTGLPTSSSKTGMVTGDMYVYDDGTRKYLCIK